MKPPRLVGILATLAIVFATNLATGAPAYAEDADAPLFIVLDTSGSMNDGSPQTKLESAKVAALSLVRDLPSGQQVTLVSYPGGRRTIEGCSAGDVRFGPAAVDVARVSADIRSLKADGETPIGPTLLHVRELFEKSGAANGSVVLLSDGEANCGETDVCEVAGQLNDAGLALTVNTVGLDISDEGYEQLQCIADATGGKSIRLGPEDDLAEALAAASVAQLDLHVDVPSAMESVTGSRDARSTNQIAVTVTSTGAQISKNVRVVLQLQDGASKPGAVYTPRPVRHLGNLGGAVTSATVAFVPRPRADTFGPIRWKVIATADNAAEVYDLGSIELVTSTDLSSAGVLLTEAKHVVVLGDSYSSGEGAGNYDKSNDKSSGVFACHRSANAYARVLYGGTLFGPSTTPVTFLPCSGAKTVDMRTYQHLTDVAPQLRQLHEVMKRPAPPDLVLMTLGGNDAGFGDFVTACVLGGVLVDSAVLTDPLRPHPCGTDPDSSSSEDMAPYLVSSTLVKDLKSSYEDVDALLNSPDAVKARSGRTGQIVVLPYVNPLPSLSQVKAGCFLGLSTVEASFALNLLDKVNGAVRTAVGQARQLGIPIRLAESVASAFQDGHTICDMDSAVVTKAVLARKVSDRIDQARRQQELMHPNHLGHRLEAQALIEWSRGQTSGWDTPHVPVKTEVGVKNYITELVWQLGGTTVPRVVGIVEAGAPLPAECTSLLNTNECRMVQRSRYVTVQLHSDPRFIGAVWSPGNGFSTVTMPSDAEPGRHQLVISAVMPDGEVHRWTRPITVHRAGTAVTVMALLLGTVLTLFGALLVWWPRIRSATSTRIRTSSQS